MPGTVIKLTPEMLGEIDADGSMGKRPTKDILGNDITAMHPTIKRLTFNGKRYFVTIPINRDHPDTVYELAQQDPGPTPAPALKPKS